MISSVVADILAVFQDGTHLELTKLENLYIDIHKQSHLRAIFTYETSLYKVELSSFLKSLLS